MLAEPCCPRRGAAQPFPTLLGKQLCQGSLTHAEMLLCLARLLPVLDHGLVLPISTETNLGDVSLADDAAEAISCCSLVPHHSMVCLHLSLPTPKAPSALAPPSLQPHPCSRLFLVLMIWEGLGTVQDLKWRKCFISSFLSFPVRTQNDYTEINSIINRFFHLRPKAGNRSENLHASFFPTPKITHTCRWSFKKGFPNSIYLDSCHLALVAVMAVCIFSWITSTGGYFLFICPQPISRAFDNGFWHLAGEIGATAAPPPHQAALFTHCAFSCKYYKQHPWKGCVGMEWLHLVTVSWGGSSALTDNPRVLVFRLLH